MKIKLKTFIYITIAIGISYNLVWYVSVFFAKTKAQHLYKVVQTHNKVYVYETYSRALNNVICINNLEDSSKLIVYYDNMALGIDTSVDISNFNTMPLTTKYPIYVLNDFGTNSRMIELIDFDTVCWGYIKGYVYNKTIHQFPPPDSVIKEKEEFFKKQKNENMKNQIHDYSSPYGWYCNNCN